MENASKAVIMAGGVLIAVAVISLALYAYSSFRSYAESSEQLFTATQIQNFNRFYQAYPEGNNTIRVIDAINIYNRALDDGLENINSNFNILAIADDSTTFLGSCSYFLGYDTQGKVSRITLNR